MTNRTSNIYKDMKPQSIITIFLMALVAFSCSQTPEGIEGKKTRLAEAKAEIKSLETEISDLESQLKAEDPTYNKVNETSTLITTIAAANKSFEHKIEIRGNVESRTNLNVSAEMMGQLTAVNIREGQSVKEGQVLATIDSDNLQKSIDELNTQLSFANTIFEKRDLDDLNALLIEKNQLLKNVSASIEKQVARIRTDETSPKNTTLYFSVLLETKDLIKALMNLLETYEEFHLSTKNVK